MVVLDPEHAPDVMSDADLVADAQRGSTAAFAALYERHHHRILGHCRSRIGGNDAADAAQETFLRAWRALEGFGGEARVYPWLRTIATNVCIDTLRRRSRSVPVAEVDVAPVEDGTDLGLLALHTEAMTEALTRLSERHRSVLQLREYEGWTYERIADHEHLDLSAVKSLLWRARQSLRREFLLVSAQGRLSALAGVLSLGRLRDLLNQVGASSAQLGAGGTVAAATAVAAVVAVPALTTSTPPPAAAPPPVVVVTTVAPASAPITVRSTHGRPKVVARVAPTTTTTAVATVAAAATVEVASGPITTTSTTSTVPAETSGSSSGPSTSDGASSSDRGESARADASSGRTGRTERATADDTAKASAKERAAEAKAAEEAAKRSAKERAAAAKAADDAAKRAAKEAAAAKAEAERAAAKAAKLKGQSESGRRATVELTTTTTTAPPATTTTTSTTAPPSTERRGDDRDHDDHGDDHGEDHHGGRHRGEGRS